MKRRIKNLTVLNLTLAGAVAVSGVNLFAEGTNAVATNYIYHIGAYSAGHSYYSLCSNAFPCSPYHFKLEEEYWSEDTNGYTLMDFSRKPQPSDIARSVIEVECGSERFEIPFDSQPAKPSKTSNVLPVAQGSGNLAEFLMQCVTNRGGRNITNALPVLPATWLRHSRSTLDVILIHGDKFEQVQNLLQQTYGTPNEIGISPSMEPDTRMLTYLPSQIGVVLNVTSPWDRTITIVSIIPRQIPKALH